MRDRKRDWCPKCGNHMLAVEHSQRTVPGGMWYVSMCPNCLHRADVFKPRRHMGNKKENHRQDKAGVP